MQEVVLFFVRDSGWNAVADSIPKDGAYTRIIEVEKVERWGLNVLAWAGKDSLDDPYAWTLYDTTEAIESLRKVSGMASGDHSMISAMLNRIEYIADGKLK